MTNHASPEVFDLNGKRVFRIHAHEAQILVSCRWAEWRGRNQRAITISIPTSACIAFIHAYRHKPRPDATAIDSRTHKYLGGVRGYRHVRNEAYETRTRRASYLSEWE